MNSQSKTLEFVPFVPYFRKKTFTIDLSFDMDGSTSGLVAHFSQLLQADEIDFFTIEDPPVINKNFQLLTF